MEYITGIISFFSSPAGAALLAALLAVSEAMAMIPAVKANGIFEFLYTALQKLVKKPEVSA
jgi:hypothetical protein